MPSFPTAVSTTDIQTSAQIIPNEIFFNMKQFITVEVFSRRHFVLMDLIVLNSIARKGLLDPDTQRGYIWFGKEDRLAKFFIKMLFV